MRTPRYILRTTAAANLASLLVILAPTSLRAQTPPEQAGTSYCILGTICADEQPVTAPAKRDKLKTPPPLLGAYKENYFDLAVKNFGPSSLSPWVFKLGVKTPLLNIKNGSNGVYLGYRMTGYWDINAESAPFRDINHNPSIFWQHQFKEAPPGLDSFEAGFEHISNGQDNTSTGPGNTGINRSRSIAVAAFVEPRFQFLDDDIVYQPRFWVPRGTSENSHIRTEWGLLWHTLTYRNRLEMAVKGNPFDQGQASVKIHYGLTSLLHGFTADTYDAGPKVSLTLFNGYGDGLLQYQQRRTWVRLGLSFSLYKN